MSLHTSLVAVRGNAKNALEHLLRQCSYSATAPPKHLTEWTHLDNELVGPEDKAVCLHGGWTTLVDPEFTVMLEDDRLAQLSAPRAAPVLTMICEGVSDTYGFALFKNGVKTRSLTVSAGKIVENTGQALTEENGLNPKDLDEKHLLEILQRLGYSYESLHKTTDITVHKLRFTGPHQSDELAKTVELLIQGPPVQMKRRKNR
jgi:hypothetical protein